jgi:hypothetical protein
VPFQLDLLPSADALRPSPKLSLGVRQKEKRCSGFEVWTISRMDTWGKGRSCSDVLSYLNQCALTKPSLFARSNWTFLASAVVKTKEKVPSANRGSYMNPGDVRTQS